MQSRLPIFSSDMIVRTILYHPKFVKEFQGLHTAIQQRAMRVQKQFRANPLHPSLRLHQLKGRLDGLWSVSLTMSVRIIFQRMDNGDIIFLSIGKHDIYRSL